MSIALGTLIAVLLALGACTTAPPSIPRQMWAGSYRAIGVTAVDDQSAFSGSILRVRDRVEIEASNRVKAELGVGFGVRVEFPGAKSDEAHGLRVRWSFPEPGLVDLRTGKRVAFSERDARCQGAACAIGWILVREDEVLRGTWTVDLRRGDQVILSQTFELY